MAELKSLIVNGVTRLNNTGYAQQLYAAGFHHSAVDSNSYVLLAGGGYTSLSGLSSTHNHDDRYLPLAGGSMTGTIDRTYSASNQTPFIHIDGKDYDNYIWKISSGTTTNQYYGFGLKYIGTGNGVDNRLRLYADNQNGTDVIAFSVNQSGQVGIGKDSSTAYALDVSGNTNISGYILSPRHRTANYEIAESNSRVCVGTHNQTTAAGLNAGSLLISNAWADASKVPTNGIYSKGVIKSGVAQGTAPFTVDSSTLVTNFNADLLDGKHASDFATSGHSHNYYWANYAIQSSANYLTTPYFQYIYFRNTGNSGAAGYIGRGSSGNNDIYLVGYSGSGVSIGANGNASHIYIDTSGNVGIGTTSPSYKLHVIGNVKVTKRLETGFKNFLATGCGEITEGTIDSSFIPVVRYSNGCMGSFYLKTAYSAGSGSSIPAAWYNYIYIPHREGSGNGDGTRPSSGDNCNYGNGIFFSMTGDGGIYGVRYSSESIAKTFRICDSRATYVDASGAGWINGTKITLIGNADTVDSWHKDNINWTGYVTSATANLSSYWYIGWTATITDKKQDDLDMTFLISSSFNSLYGMIHVRIRQEGNNGGGAYNFGFYVNLLYGNIPLDRVRLAVNNSTGKCDLWFNVAVRWGVFNITVVKKCWRTSNDVASIGTLNSVSFTTAQTVPSLGSTCKQMEPINQYTNVIYASNSIYVNKTGISGELTKVELRNTTGSVDIAYDAIGSTKRLWFGVGSGNNNRGIYGYYRTVSNNTESFTSGKWYILFADDSATATTGNKTVLQYGGSLTLQNNNLTLTGNYYANSDIRLKNIISTENLTAEQFISFPVIKYKWKDGRDNKLHLGSTAQSIENIFPELVSESDDGTKNLDYTTLGAIGVISLAREIVKLKKQIKELQKKLNG